jgi:predicted  nucleic acid-binding Zn-ribbon protein
MQPNAVRRRLFGFSPKDVGRLLADREWALEQANIRARMAEAKLGQTSAEVEALRASLDERDQAVAALNERVTSLGQELTQLSIQLDAERRAAQERGSTVTARFLSGLAPLLQAAEESAAQMFEQVRESTEQQVAEAGRIRQLLRVELEQVDVWRSALQDVIATVQSKLEQSREQIQGIPQRVEEALAPLAGAVTSLGGDLDELVRATRPPTLEPIFDTAEETSSPSSDQPPTIVPDGSNGHGDVQIVEDWVEAGATLGGLGL